MEFINRYKYRVIFVLSALASFSGLAEDKDFRGWQAGDWVVASTFRDMTDTIKMAELISDPLKRIEFVGNSVREETVWCKIEAANKDSLLVVGYYYAERTTGQVNRNEKYDYKKIEAPKKFNLMGATNLVLVEWPKNSEPPRPKNYWRSFFQK